MLNKRYRLTKRGSFNYVYRKGESRPNGALKITYVRGKGAPKAGISVPNSVGKAVVRNKIRRRIRAVLQPLMPRVKPAQLVISVRKGAEEMTFAQIETTVTELLEKGGLYVRLNDEKKENNNCGHN